MPAKKATKKAAGQAKKTAVGAKKKAAPKKKAAAPKKKAVQKEMMECSHCLGAGKCTAGEIFDKDRHQSLFQEQRMTSCPDCLTAAGRAPNSKKLVACSICQGTGEVEKE